MFEKLIDNNILLLLNESNTPFYIFFFFTILFRKMDINLINKFSLMIGSSKILKRNMHIVYTFSCDKLITRDIEKLSNM